jgi:SM-20-related protein
MTVPNRGPLPACHQYRDFLDESEHSALLEWTLSHRERFVPAAVVGHGVDPARRIAELYSRLGPLRAVFERRLAAGLDDIFRRTGTRPFEVEYIELDIAAHGDGAFYGHHTDIPFGRGRKPLGGDVTGTQDRLVSCVYYYHREPKGFTGGALRLFRFADPDAQGDYVEFEPEQNSLVVFPSWARHEVRPVTCPSREFEDYRFAVNGWLCRTLAPRMAADGPKT